MTSDQQRDSGKTCILAHSFRSMFAFLAEIIWKWAKEATYVKCEKPKLNGGGLRFHLPNTSNAALNGFTTINSRDFKGTRDKWPTGAKAGLPITDSLGMTERVRQDEKDFSVRVDAHNVTAD